MRHIREQMNSEKHTKIYKIIVKNSYFTRPCFECIILLENMKSITDFAKGKESYYGLQKDRTGNSG